MVKRQVGDARRRGLAARCQQQQIVQLGIEHAQHRYPGRCTSVARHRTGATELSHGLEAVVGQVSAHPCDQRLYGELMAPGLTPQGAQQRSTLTAVDILQVLLVAPAQVEQTAMGDKRGSAQAG